MKNNKGFSMVELIIVIAIMAILAGALAPALIKYINKSRISTDISNGQSIASGIQNALSKETAFEDASETGATPSDYAAFVGAQGPSMSAELVNIIGKQSGKSKAKKDASGTTIANPSYYISCNPAQNIVTVYAGSSGADYMVYPTVGANWTEK